VRSEANGITVFKKGTPNRSIVVIPIAGHVYRSSRAGASIL